MRKEYCPPHEVQKLEDEFWEIKQVGGDNTSYTARFKQLSIICPSQVNTSEKAITKYIRGFPECVGDFVEAARHATIEETYRLAVEINDKRVLDGFFSKNPVKQAHQAIVIDSSDDSSSESSDESSDDNASLQEAQLSRKRKTMSPNSSTTELSQPEPLQAIPIHLKHAYNGTHPLCLTCTYHHPPEANCRNCANYNWYGHLTQHCRTGPQT
ncbi:putative retrotransposon gag domain-containing protein [Helianthus annuus]|nr:putative retrotransposon gag domain-containing protein [Helianthus annuus]